jgi:hypothetical protein
MPRLAGLSEPSAAFRDWDRGCGRPIHARAGSRRSPDFRRELVERQQDGGGFGHGVADVNAKCGATVGDDVLIGGFECRVSTEPSIGGSSGDPASRRSIQDAFMAVPDPGPRKRPKPDHATVRHLRIRRRSRAMVFVRTSAASSQPVIEDYRRLCRTRSP